MTTVVVGALATVTSSVAILLGAPALSVTWTDSVVVTSPENAHEKLPPVAVVVVAPTCCHWRRN